MLSSCLSNVEQNMSISIQVEIEKTQNTFSYENKLIDITFIR